MNLLDIVIILMVLLEVRRGAQIGIVRSFFSLTGFWIGLLLGAALTPYAVKLASDASGKMLLTIACVLSVAFVGSLLGQALAGHLSKLTHRLKLAPVDAALGAVFSAVVSLFIIWLFASVFSGVPFRNINRQIQTSAIIRVLDEKLPPAPTVLARINRLISPYGFPEVFIGREPAPAAPVDPATAAEIAKAVAAAEASTVRIEGAGCGGTVSGSGFVAAPGLIVTNAHVVAGINRPITIDQNGRHRASAVYFDPDLDLAILRADGLAGEPLPLAPESVPRGTAAVALGYPEGGPFRAVPAGVSQQFEARGRDIYSRGITLRTVYELQTMIESGNSGGPVVLTDGTVIGVVFARSQTTDNIGYAITSPDVMEALEQARTAGEVTTGRCAT